MMDRVEIELNGAQAQHKPRWRTPTLTLEQVVHVTGADLVAVGDDDSPVTYGGQGFSS